MAGARRSLWNPSSCPSGPDFHLHPTPAWVAGTCSVLACLGGPIVGTRPVLALLLGAAAGMVAAIRHCNPMNSPAP